MYFSRIRLRKDANANQLAKHLTRRGTYAEHQQLWRLFSRQTSGQRDFLYRREDQAETPQFYLLSKTLPEDLDQYWYLEYKRYQPELRAGEILAFNLRANPTITRTVDGKRQRHDLVMDMKRQMNWKAQPQEERPMQTELWQEAGEQWLSTRLLKHGAQLQSLNAERYQRHSEQKGKSKTQIRYSSLDLAGTLQVTEPQSFTKCVMQGIGPAKSFGCGLMLIRRT